MASGKTKATCSECRRRKQKCSGSWPCRHCTSRRVIPRCHFQAGKTDAFLIEHEAKRRMNWHDYEAGHEVCHVSRAPPDVKALGYSNGLAHLSFDNPKLPSSDVMSQSQDKDADNLRRALQALPPRSLTDSLVEYYLEHVNNTYCAIQREPFGLDYQLYCDTRMARTSVSPAFVCLLLQICANTLQEVSGALQAKVEYELGETSSDASVRLYNSAESLSHSLPPGAGGVHQSLQLLLAAAWLKSEGKIVEAWHALARAVREEQECSQSSKDVIHILKASDLFAEMHDADRMPEFTDIDREVRTRTWCYTMLWDWQMAHWLDRPLLIDTAEDQFHSPNLTVDQSPEGAPSSFANTFNQYKLVHMLRTRFGRIGLRTDPEHVEGVLLAISEWTTQLPSELTWQDPNTQWDAKHPWIVLQRLQLHAFVAMVRFTPLKHYLIYPDASSGIHNDLRRQAMRCAIECIDAALELLTVIAPARTRFHFVMFVLFDTTTLIISAVLHDTVGDLTNDKEILDTCSLALQAMQDTSKLTVFAKSASSILQGLISKLPACWAHRLQSSGLESGDQLEYLTRANRFNEQTSKSYASSTPPAAESFEMPLAAADQTMTPPSELLSEGFGEFELNGIEQIWDWQALDFGFVNAE